MNAAKEMEHLRQYAVPEVLDIEFACVFPGAGVGPSEGDVEGENTGLDKEMDTDGDFGD